ncbi:MAG: hypothetical protein ABEJ79_06180 [Halolamina sp.]
MHLFPGDLAVGVAVAGLVDAVAALGPRLRLVGGAVAVAVGAVLTSVGVLSPVMSGTADRPTRGLRPRRRGSETRRDADPADGDAETTTGRRGDDDATRQRAVGLVALGAGCLVVGVALFASVRPGL